MPPCRGSGHAATIAVTPANAAQIAALAQPRGLSYNHQLTNEPVDHGTTTTNTAGNPGQSRPCRRHAHPTASTPAAIHAHPHACTGIRSSNSRIPRRSTGGCTSSE
ncbi:hypothetical protein EDD38_3246 [Kitasatospora cineracea]|uniref:Uncharacterized protein n=1 Tax=Kitasatospora cineracea TaxID=88074 RepID=A0A3N4SEL9_9ACTN|nr:hypothetical protein EDD38_3246 [Kitasatospora cineracea]